MNKNTHRMSVHPYDRNLNGKHALSILSIILLTVIEVYSQIGRVGINTTTPQAMLHVQDSNVLFVGPAILPGTPGAPPVSGAGTRMMWYADKAALRAGSVSGTQWDTDSIGYFSFAFGENGKALGGRSFVGGGADNAASGSYSYIGGGALNFASGSYSYIGSGFRNTASGLFDSYIGGGSDNIASGAATFIGGGHRLLARSFSEVVFGTFNTDYTPAATLTINPTDRLFVIGNGTNNSNRNNAVTVLKNGRLGIGTDLPKARLHVQDSSVVFTAPATLPETPGPPPVSGAGTRMMWYPDKAALRAGRITGTQWDIDSIGTFSIAFGVNVKSKGDYSFVGGGERNSASGLRSFVGGGSFNTASRSRAFVGGGFNNVASETAAFVGGGLNNTASEINAFVGGGEFNTASGSGSFIGGGLRLLAPSYSETVFGTLNTEYIPSSTLGIIATDRLFVIGNGTNTNNRSNALTILKNGNVGIGVDTPTHRLHVRRDGSPGASGNTNAVAVFERNSTAYLNILTPDANSSGVLFGNTSSSAHGGILYNDPVTPFGLQFRTNGNATRMVVTENGRVGIGNNTPERTLHVSSGSSGATSNSAAVAVFERSGSAVINLLTPNANFSGILFGNVTNDGHGSIVYNNSIVNNGLSFQTNGGITRMVVTSAGNVGINTTSPQAKLDVEGNVKLGTTGSVLAHVIKTTVNVNLPSIAAFSSHTQSFTVTNSEINSSALISPASALADGLIVAYARVSAANTVEAKFMNATGAAINPPAMDFFITVIK